MLICFGRVGSFCVNVNGKGRVAALMNSYRRVRMEEGHLLMWLA